MRVLPGIDQESVRRYQRMQSLEQVAPEQTGTPPPANTPREPPFSRDSFTPEAPGARARVPQRTPEQELMADPSIQRLSPGTRQAVSERAQALGNESVGQGFLRRLATSNRPANDVP